MKHALTVSGFALVLLISLLWWRDHRVMDREAARLRSEIERLQVAAADAAKSAPAQSVQSREPAPTAPVVSMEPSAPLPNPATPAPEPAPVAPATSPDRPPLSEEQVNAIGSFDAAMDREFERLEARERAATDPREVDMILRIKEKLVALDELYRRADTVTDPAERVQIQIQMQQEMGSIIGLTRRDRNERLGNLATQIGYNDPQAIELFVQEVDRIYYETHMDWTKLFNRAPPP